MGSLLSDQGADIGALVVSAEARSHGIGKLLLAEGEFWARSKGFKSLWVRSNTKRTNAHRFYQREGYRFVKSWNLFTKDL